MKEIKANPIQSDISFKELCKKYNLPADFLTSNSGRGYSKDDAIICNGHEQVETEQNLIENRNLLEFTYLPKTGASYRNINWDVEQIERFENDSLKKIRIKITGLPYEAWLGRRIEWKENGHNENFDKEWFAKRTLELTKYCYRDFWFKY